MKTSPKRLLHSRKTIINISKIEDEIKRMRKNILNISHKDFILTKKLFKILNIPYFDAPLEGETMCADLCKRGLVDAVLSEDSDVIAYGTPVFLCKINTKRNTCIIIEYNKVLQALGLTSRELLDFCIMCGTDYNKNIFRIGPNRAYEYIKQYSSIEKMKENTNLDISILNHIRGRQLFNDYKKVNIKIPFCGNPNFDNLRKFVFLHGIRANLEGLKKAMTHNIVVFEEEEKDVNLVISKRYIPKEEEIKKCIINQKIKILGPTGHGRFSPGELNPDKKIEKKDSDRECDSYGIE